MVNWAFYTVHCLLSTTHAALHSVRWFCVVSIVHHPLIVVDCSLLNVHRALFTVYFWLHGIQWLCRYPFQYPLCAALRSLNLFLSIVHFILLIVHFLLSTVYCTTSTGFIYRSLSSIRSHCPLVLVHCQWNTAQCSPCFVVHYLWLTEHFTLSTAYFPLHRINCTMCTVFVCCQLCSSSFVYCLLSNIYG